MANPLQKIAGRIMSKNNTLGTARKFNINPRTGKISRTKINEETTTIATIQKKKDTGKKAITTNPKGKVEDMITINGIVKKANNACLPEADISIFGILPKKKTYTNLEINAKSDDKGKYNVAIPDRYSKIKLICSYPGYLTSEKELDNKKATTTLDFNMKRKAIKKKK